MNNVLLAMLKALGEATAAGFNILPGSSPVPSFGDPESAVVATVGLNPSNLEFVDANGKELSDRARRFHTLTSLGLRSWANARESHLSLIWHACRNYFGGNPYLPWFNQLDKLLGPASYFKRPMLACHLDLVPFATARKWSGLVSNERDALLLKCGDLLGQVILDSNIRVLVLNGSSVVRGFERLAELRLLRHEAPAWTLRAKSAAAVRGVAYSGAVSRLGSVDLGREVQVLGYNLNLQSSFGVTNAARAGIRDWIGSEVESQFQVAA